jgi:hypothetical protein
MQCAADVGEGEVEAGADRPDGLVARAVPGVRRTLRSATSASVSALPVTPFPAAQRLVQEVGGFLNV